MHTAGPIRTDMWDWIWAAASGCVGGHFFLLGKGLAITLLRRYDRLYGRHASPDALYQFCGERHEDPNSPFYYGKGGISLE